MIKIVIILLSTNDTNIHKLAKVTKVVKLEVHKGFTREQGRGYGSK